TADSVAGGIFQLTQHYAMRRVFGPWLGDLTDHYIGVGFHPLLAATIGTYHDRAFLILHRILLNDEREWFKDDADMVLSREEILARALNDALTYLQKNIGSAPEQWQWGKLHKAWFNHPLGARKPLDRIFNRGPLPYGGDTNTVWQA